MPKDLYHSFKKLLADPVYFTQTAGHIALRSYQQSPFLSIIESCLYNLGRSFVIMFPRQSGKNELQAQLEAYLLLLFSTQGASMVKVSPTWKPQSINAMLRLEKVLNANLVTRRIWSKNSGYIFTIQNASLAFLSGSPESHIVGHTASTLLEMDEAQDIPIPKYDKEIAPMAASTNATRVFYGTAWTSDTLLAREVRACREAEAQDLAQRVFIVNADDVGLEVPQYQVFVNSQVSKLGRHHPMIKTQFYCEEIDTESSLFPPGRILAFSGNHGRIFTPHHLRNYIFCIDVAGADESISSKPGHLENTSRDSTALTIFEIDSSNAPSLSYKIVNRAQWTNVPQSELLPIFQTLIETWRPIYAIIDSTGIGAGLSSMLTALYRDRVIPFNFSQSSKSALGWHFIAMADTGRIKDHARDGDPLQAEFYRQCQFSRAEVLPGPARQLRWSVPDGTRDLSGNLVHDDLLISTALIAVIELQELPIASPGQSVIINGKDPLIDIDAGIS